MKDSWHSVLGILEHLHPDKDERPFNPSSHETPMEVDREVDVPPPALHPSALPPPAPLVDAGPNSSEGRKSPFGYKRFINRLVIVTIALW